MTTAVALSKITGEMISTAALVGLINGQLVFDCAPPQRVEVSVTNKMIRMKSDRWTNVHWAARFLYEAEAKVLLKLAEASRKEV